MRGGDQPARRAAARCDPRRGASSGGATTRRATGDRSLGRAHWRADRRRVVRRRAVL